MASPDPALPPWPTDDVDETVKTRYGTLVRYSWRTHTDAWTASNLFLIGDGGAVVWRSELPVTGEKDCWPNPLHGLTEEVVRCVSMDGWDCAIDLRTGKILEKEWGK